MNKLTKNTTTNTVKSAQNINTNQKQTAQKQTMKSKVIETTVLVNESLELSSSCFILGYN